MTVKVRIHFEATYESPDENQANASILRIKSTLPHVIADSRVPGVPSGVTQGSVKVVKIEGVLRGMTG